MTPRGPAAANEGARAAVHLEAVLARDITVDQSRGKTVVQGNVTIVVVESATRLAALPTPGAALLGPPHAPREQPPFKGLSAFQEADAADFFGRDRLIDRLWTRLVSLHRPAPDGTMPARFLAILGASGSGKSSVARAGLVAELARRPLVLGRPTRVAVLTPGPDPLRSLDDALALAGQDPAARAGAGPLLLLLVDQFEEVYTLCRDAAARDAFISRLVADATRADGAVSVVVTLRTDFVERTNASEVLSALVAEQSVLVPVMSRDDLREAIARPAQRAGYAIDAATVELLVESSRNRDGVLAHLEFALTRIWDGLTRGEPAAETLRRIGGVGGALANTARELFAGLIDERDRAIARRAFLRMVQVPRDETTALTRRRVSLRDLVAHGEGEARVRVVLERFADPSARVVTFSSRADDEVTVEITHEALLEHWEELRAWVTAERDDLIFRDHLQAAVDRWEARERAPTLLWGPPDLDQLRDLARRQVAELTTTERAFLDASVGRRRRRTAGIGAAAVLALGVAALPTWRGMVDLDGSVGRSVVPVRSDTLACPIPAAANRIDAINATTFISRYAADLQSPPDAARRAILGSLLDAIVRDSCLHDVRWAAYTLATAEYETARTMIPLEEYGQGQGHDYGEPVTVTDSAGRQYTNRYYGRGYVQITGRQNYQRIGRRLGMGDQLLLHPERAVEPAIAFHTLSLAMRDGSFTGKRLATYIDATHTDYVNARRVINGVQDAQRIAERAARIEQVLRQSAERRTE